MGSTGFLLGFYWVFTGFYLVVFCSGLEWWCRDGPSAADVDDDRHRADARAECRLASS